MGEFQQLKYYISLGAPPIRTIADGSESFMRPEVGFNPSWFNESCGIDFSEKWHKNPQYRLEAWEKMAGEIRKRFPGYNIGRVFNNEPPDLLTGIFGIGIMDLLFDRPVQYFSDKWPVPVGDKMTDKEINQLNVPGLENHPFMHNIFEQIEKVYELTGSVKGYMNWQGNLNTAFRFRGQELFSDFMMQPELAEKLLDVISDTYIKAVNMVYAKQKEFGEDNRFATIANCTVNMVGPETYENSLLKYDQKIAENFDFIGIHNCAWTVTPYVDPYNKIKKIGYIDMGIDSDLEKVKTVFPQARRNCLYTSIDLKNKTKKAIREDFEKIARNLAPCDVGLPDIEFDVPDEKIMYAIDLCHELSIN